MNPLLIGYWRGFKAVNAGGAVTPYTDDYGPLYRFMPDGTVQVSYKHAGKWGFVQKFKVVEKDGTTEIQGDMMPIFIKSVTETELIVDIMGTYKVGLTYYFKRLAV